MADFFNVTSNVSQFGPDDCDINRYKQAGEYALESKQWACLSKQYHDDAVTDVTNILENAGDQETLVALAQPIGATKVGFERDWSTNNTTTVANFLSASRVNLWEFKDLCTLSSKGADGLDWAPALEAALIQCAKERKTLYVPGRNSNYYISKVSALSNQDPSGGASLMSVYSMVGDGANQTKFYSDTSNAPVLEFLSCRVMFKGWSLSGPGDTAYAGLKLGDVSTISAVRLSILEDIKLGWFSNPLMIGHMWDSTFTHLHVQFWGRNGVYIQERSVDNTNNLTFIHLHLEGTTYNAGNTCRGFVCMGGNSSGTKNHSIRLIQPHIEPRNWNCQHFYISNCNGVFIDTPSINRNNDIVGIPNNRIVPAVHIITSTNVQFKSGQITHIGTRADDVGPIIQIEGVVKAIKFDCYIDTGKATVTNFASGIDWSNSPNASREVFFDGSPVGSFTSFSSVKNFLTLSVLDNIQRSMSIIAEQYPIPSTSSNGTVLRFMHRNASDPATGATEIMHLDSEGFLQTKANLSPVVTIEAGATYTHVVGAGTNNRRGEYKITGLENDNTLFGSFFNVPNLDPKPTGIIGDGINLSRTQPATTVTNKLCIYQSGQYIVLENRRAAPVTLAIRFDSGIK